MLLNRCYINHRKSRLRLDHCFIHQYTFHWFWFKHILLPNIYNRIEHKFLQLIWSSLQYHTNIGLTESMTDNKYINIYDVEKTRCVGMTRMSPPWILRRLTNVSPFFNSLSNRLRITNYCLRSVSSSLLKYTRFIQGNNIAWTNLDMIRNLQHLHMNKKSYAYKTLPFNSYLIFFWIKSVMWSE